jgi:hypothetical protein
MARYIDEYPATWRKGAVFHERALDLRAGDRDVGGGATALAERSERGGLSQPPPSRSSKSQ